jgi:PadR family transcriptional regulator PadR
MQNPFSAKAALLQALTTGPGYGLELRERIRDRTGNRVRIRLGSLYPALRALERAGLVRSWDGARQRGRPRRYYELTIEGIRSAEEIRSVMGLFTGDTARSPTSQRDRSKMRDRIHRCARVSAFTAELRRRVAAMR